MTLVANTYHKFKAMHIKIKEELAKKQQEHREQMAEQEAKHNIAKRTWLKQEPKPPEAEKRPKIVLLEEEPKPQVCKSTLLESKITLLEVLQFCSIQRAVVQKTTPQAAIILYII